MNRTLTNLLTACLAGAFCALLAILPPVQRLEQEFGLRWLFQLRGARQPPQDILLVAINAESASRIFLPKDPYRYHRCIDLRIGSAPQSHVALPELPARWPRCLHAQLVDALSNAGARLVVFDMLFRPRAPDASADDDVNLYQDSLLATAAISAGNVLIAGKVEPTQHGDDTKLAQLSAIIADGVLGSAPFPLVPSDTRRIDSFFVFLEDGWSRPSLAMVALQAAHLDNYPELLGLLRSGAPEAAQFLPTAVEEIKQQRHLQSLSLHLRQIVRQNPELARSEIGKHRGTIEIGLGPLLQAYAGDATRWLNFYGPSGTIESIGFDEALALRGEKATAGGNPLNRRFVFVGYVEPNRQEQVEHFSTPFSAQNRSDLSGLEILATAFANLARGESLQTTPAPVHAVVNFSAAALAAAAAIALGLWGGIGAIAVLGAGWGWAAVTLFAIDNRWLPTFSPLALALPLGFGTGFAARYLHARRERAQLRRTLAALVPSEVADALAANAGNALAVRTTFESICVATDATQFTKLAERMHTEALADLLNRYFGDLFRQVAAHQGFVADIVGDAMLGVWRLDLPAARKEVCLALLEMVDATARFNADSPDTALPTRFGAALGPITLGSLGAEQRYEYRAIGDTVNTASRLQELNKRLGTHVLVTRTITAGLTEFLVRDVGRFVLRGKSHAVDVVELVGLRDAAEPRLVALCERFDQAMRLIQSGYNTEALADLREIAREYPEDGAARFYLAVPFRGGRRRDDAIIVR